jgi:hypothetical protein
MNWEPKDARLCPAESDNNPRNDLGDGNQARLASRSPRLIIRTGRRVLGCEIVAMMQAAESRQGDHLA